jgi:hypothetical protein
MFVNYEESKLSVRGRCTVATWASRAILWQICRLHELSTSSVEQWRHMYALRDNDVTLSTNSSFGSVSNGSIIISFTNMTFIYMNV